jgi:hypothetical protein
VDSEPAIDAVGRDAVRAAEGDRINGMIWVTDA